MKRRSGISSPNLAAGLQESVTNNKQMIYRSSGTFCGTPEGFSPTPAFSVSLLLSGGVYGSNNQKPCRNSQSTKLFWDKGKDLIVEDFIFVHKKNKSNINLSLSQNINPKVRRSEKTSCAWKFSIYTFSAHLDAVCQTWTVQ